MKNYTLKNNMFGLLLNHKKNIVTTCLPNVLANDHCYPCFSGKAKKSGFSFFGVRMGGDM